MRGIAVIIAAVGLVASVDGETLVWQGNASSNWNKTDKNWLLEGQAVAWREGADAKFTQSDTV